MIVCKVSRKGRPAREAKMIAFAVSAIRAAAVALADFTKAYVAGHKHFFAIIHGTHKEIRFKRDVAVLSWFELA